MYKLRRSVNQKNLFDIAGSIDDSTKAITVLEEMIELMNLLEDDATVAAGKRQKYVTLGKAYGTRGQGYTMLIHQNEGYLKKAIADFDKALAHFYLERDKERQYIYKTQAYAESGKFGKALTSLFEACQKDKTKHSLEQLLATIKEGNVNQEIFKYNAYFKIVRIASLRGDSLADEMYDALIKQQINVEQLKSHYNYLHPMQFILWNAATYLFTKNKLKPAMNYLDEAIRLCEVPYSEPTIRVIQLGMFAEKIIRLEELNRSTQAEIAKNQLKISLQQLKQVENASLIFRYLEGIDLENFSETNRLKQLIRLTNCIN